MEAIHQQPARPTVELSFKATNLQNKDLLSKSDPQVILYQLFGDEWVHEGETEKIKNNLNPVFKKSIKLDYVFEAVQQLSIMVIDIDSGCSKKAHKDLSKQDIIGSVNITLGELISFRKSKFELRTAFGEICGFIDIGAEIMQKSNSKVHLLLKGTDLDKKDTFGKSDPYFKIFKKTDNDIWEEVYKSETIMKDLNPVFKKCKVEPEKLFGGDQNRQLKFEVYDWDKVGAHDLIGTFETSYAQLNHNFLTHRDTFKYDLIHHKKVGKSGYKNSGVISFTFVGIIPKHTLINYLVGGLEIELMIAIDCTDYNGEVDLGHSLHKTQYGTLNPYQECLQTIVPILAPFDSDGMYHVYGYGGRHSKPNNQDSTDCFPFDIEGRCAKGVDDLMDIYKDNIRRISFKRPANLAEIMRQAMIHATPLTQDRQKYTILLLLTYGTISDPGQVKALQQHMSEHPLSCIIVSVDHQSEALKELDTKSGGIRDYCQFVHFATSKASGSIAKDTLKNMPKQIVEYLKQSKVVPNPPRTFY